MCVCVCVCVCVCQSDPLGEDGGGHPESEVVHSLHQSQQILGPALVLWLLPRLHRERERERERRESECVKRTAVFGMERYRKRMLV